MIFKSIKSTASKQDMIKYLQEMPYEDIQTSDIVAVLLMLLQENAKCPPTKID